jgi:hypothetical protein
MYILNIKMSLSLTDITFGKYKGLPLERMLRDRGYCKWYLAQEKFKTMNEFVYNKIAEYSPLSFFMNTQLPVPDRYFNMHVPPLITLNETDEKCYAYYIELMGCIKEKIAKNIEAKKEKIYDIKAVVNWLNEFEKRYELSRDIFKEFIQAYELPNITTVIEEIKALDGIKYNGAKAYIIAKENSLKQEEFWTGLLKAKYGEEINVQFIFEKCIFDCVNIKQNIIYECKIGIKDFDENQYKKYMLTLDKYKLVYLIGYDTIVNVSDGIVKCSGTERDFSPVITVFKKEFTVEYISDLNNGI